MANKTARRKFRPPLKEGASLPCSQASSASGLAEVSQERGKEGSQSWLSQLTATDAESKAAKFSTDNAAKPKPKEVPTHEAVRSKGGIFSLDDSLCSIGVENENLSNSGDSVQDSLSGRNAIVSPGEPLHQETQTHTVLSFCCEASTPAAVSSELKKELSAAIRKFQIIEYNQDEPIDDITVDYSDSEDEAMEQGNLKEPEVSRFQRKNKPGTRRYDFGKILPRFEPQRGKKGGKNSNNTKMRTKKRVTLDLIVNRSGLSKSSASAAVSGAGHRDTTAKGDLSVYDYQPTPQQEGEEGRVERDEMTELNNSNWISKKTREEQLAVDREVLKIITKTREEIRILRETYAARKATRKNNLQFTASTKPHTFKVPQQGFRRSRRAKPSLVMREDYGSSVLQKEAYRVPHNCCHQYTALEKREE